MDAATGGMDPAEARLRMLRAIAPGYFFDRAKGLAFAAQFPKGSLNGDASFFLNADLAKSYDLRDGLRQVRRPVLIIHGHQDTIGDKTAEDIQRLDSIFGAPLYRSLRAFPMA